MNLLRCTTLIVPLLSVISLRAQDPPPAAPPAGEAAALSPVEAAIRKFNEDYSAAFNRADAAAVAAFYDEAATYTSDSGRFLNGREAVEAGLKKFFTENPGARLSAQTESVRTVTPDVAIETGLAVIASGSGAEEVTRFKAVYAKRGDAWKIVELDETVLPAADRGRIALKSLEWMVGTWKDSGSGDAVLTKVDWTKSGRFLRRSISVKRGAEETMEATEIIGWDPAAGAIRSWVFDSEGGFGEGTWTAEGNRWTVKSTATLPDGQRSTALHLFTVRGSDAYTWESTSRTLNGEVLPSIEKVEVVREAPAK